MLGDEARVRLEALWATVRPRDPASTVSWWWSLTPPLPRDWPPRPGTPILLYAYAQGHDMSGRLADGAHVSAPWALVTIGPWERGGPPDRAEPAVERIAENLEPLGIQGVRPLTRSEVDSQRMEPILPLLDGLRAHGGEPSAEVLAAVKRFYRTWVDTNGVIARWAHDRHADLFAWLDRPSISVIVCDLFHATDADHEHAVTGFSDWETAREYARRRVRASVEAARGTSRTPSEVRDTWRTFGEDARAVDGDGGRVYVGSSELERFIAEPAGAAECDYLALEPGRALEPGQAVDPGRRDAP